jgi:hypothetical protein
MRFCLLGTLAKAKVGPDYGISLLQKTELLEVVALGTGLAGTIKVMPVNAPEVLERLLTPLEEISIARDLVLTFVLSNFKRHRNAAMLRSREIVDTDPLARPTRRTETDRANVLRVLGARIGAFERG